MEKLPALVRKLKSLGYAGIEIPIAFVMKFGPAVSLAHAPPKTNAHPKLSPTNTHPNSQP